MIQFQNKWENSYNMLLGQVVIHDSPLLPEAGEGKGVFFRFNLLISSVTKKNFMPKKKKFLTKFQWQPQLQRQHSFHIGPDEKEIAYNNEE